MLMRALVGKSHWSTVKPSVPCNLLVDRQPPYAAASFVDNVVRCENWPGPTVVAAAKHWKPKAIISRVNSRVSSRVSSRVGSPTRLTSASATFAGIRVLIKIPPGLLERLKLQLTKIAGDNCQ